MCDDDDKRPAEKDEIQGGSGPRDPDHAEGQDSGEHRTDDRNNSQEEEGGLKQKGWQKFLSNGIVTALLVMIIGAIGGAVWQYLTNPTFYYLFWFQTPSVDKIELNEPIRLGVPFTPILTDKVFKTSIPPGYNCKWWFDDYPDIKSTYNCNIEKITPPSITLPAGVLKKSMQLKVRVDTPKDSDVATRQVDVYTSGTLAVVKVPNEEETSIQSLITPGSIVLTARLNGMTADDAISDIGVFDPSAKCSWTLPPDATRVPAAGTRGCRVRVKFPPNPEITKKTSYQVSVKVSPEPIDRYVKIDGGKASISIWNVGFEISMPQPVRREDSLDVKIRPANPLPDRIQYVCQWTASGSDALSRIVEVETECSFSIDDIASLFDGQSELVRDINLTASVSLRDNNGNPLPSTNDPIEELTAEGRIYNFTGLDIEIPNPPVSGRFIENDSGTVEISFADSDATLLPDGWACDIKLDGHDLEQKQVEAQANSACSATFEAPKTEREGRRDFTISAIIKDEQGETVDSGEITATVIPLSSYFHAFLVEESPQMAGNFDGRPAIHSVKEELTSSIEQLSYWGRTAGVYYFGGGGSNAPDGCVRHDWHAEFQRANNITNQIIDQISADESSPAGTPLYYSIGHVIRVFDEYRRGYAVPREDLTLTIVALTMEGETCPDPSQMSANGRAIDQAREDIRLQIRNLDFEVTPITIFLTNEPDRIAEDNGEQSSTSGIDRGRADSEIFIPVSNTKELRMVLELITNLSNPDKKEFSCSELIDHLNIYRFDYSQSNLRNLCFGNDRR